VHRGCNGSRAVDRRAVTFAAYGCRVNESGRRVPGEGGGVGDPVQVDGVGDAPLRPDEYETYRTDPNPERERMAEPDTAAAARESRPWIAIGLVLLAIFVAILVWAVAFPLL
jgi:hypothetical protein